MSKLNEVLKNGEKVSRKVWTCKRYIQLQQDNVIRGYALQSDLSFKEETWKKADEDLLADDWKVLSDDDTTFFTLSVADLKELGSSNEIIEKIITKFPRNILLDKVSLKKLNLHNDVLKDIKLDTVINPDEFLKPYIQQPKIINKKLRD